MILAKLNKSTGESFDLSIPENASEVGLINALDFEFACFDVFEFLKNHSEEMEERKFEYLHYIIVALNSFYTGIVDFYEIDNKHLNLSSDEWNKHFSTLSNKIDYEQAEHSIISIFNLTYKAIKDTKPTLRTKDYFEYKGERFVFPTIWIDVLFQRENFNSPNVKQFIELLQNQANYIAAIKDLSKRDLKTVEHLYTKYLTDLAYLLLKEGETIPVNEVDCKKFITNRMDFFQDIDLQSAIDIEYYFNQFYESLRKDKENFYYFNSDPTTKEEQLAYIEAQNKNSDMMKRIGWKSIINRLLEIGSFNVSGKSAIEAVLTAPATDAVKTISIDNAK